MIDFQFCIAFIIVVIVFHTISIININIAAIINIIIIDIINIMDAITIIIKINKTNISIVLKCLILNTIFV